MKDAFQDRQDGFERKYAIDQDLQFRIWARRDRLFGLWLAERLGFSGVAAEQYAKDIVVSNLERPGDADLFEKVKQDLDRNQIAIPERELLAKFDQCGDEAARQINSDPSK